MGILKDLNFQKKLMALKLNLIYLLKLKTNEFQENCAFTQFIFFFLENMLSKLFVRKRINIIMIITICQNKKIHVIFINICFLCLFEKKASSVHFFHQFKKKSMLSHSFMELWTFYIQVPKKFVNVCVSLSSKNYFCFLQIYLYFSIFNSPGPGGTTGQLLLVLSE